MTEEVESVVVVNNLVATKTFNVLLSSTMTYYLSAKPGISVNFVRHNDLVCSLGLLNKDENSLMSKISNTSSEIN